MADLTATERDRAVQRIVDEALLAQRPARGSFAALLRSCSPTLAFSGVGDCVVLALLMAGVCWAALHAAAGADASVAAAAFLCAPALYAFASVLVLWKDATGGTLEWKRACRMRPQELAAVRMIVLGAVSAAACVATSVGIWSVSGRTVPLAWTLALSFSSLFAYAAVALACLIVPLPRRAAGAGSARVAAWEQAEAVLRAVVPLVAWTAAGAVLLRAEAAAGLLYAVPAYVFALVACAAAAVCCAELRRLAFGVRLEGAGYAIG